MPASCFIDVLFNKMNTIDIKLPHAIPPDEALRRIKELVTTLQHEHSTNIKNVKEKWTGHEGSLSFSVKRISVAAKIYVGVDTVRVSSRLPFVLSFYRNRITKKIWEKGTELLRK